MSDLQKKLFLFFIQFRKQAAQLRKIIGVPSLASPRISILWPFESANGCRCLAVVEQLIHRNLKSAGQLFKGRDGWDCMAQCSLLIARDLYLNAYLLTV